MLKIEIKRERRKSLTLKVVSPQKLLIKAPLLLPKAQIMQFVEAKKRWIDQQSSKLQQQISFFAGNKILLLGKIYTLKTEFSCNPAILQNDAIITVRHLQSQDPQQLLERWYKNKARKIFAEIAKIYCQKMGVRFEKLRLSSAKTRWGSCSSLGNINLNWNLVKAPKGIIAYVVAHELTHLNYPHHGKSFWHALEKIFPEYQKAKKWLAEKGGYLVSP